MGVIRGLCVTHLDELRLLPDCELRDSPLPENKHLCHVNTLTWRAPVDISVMRTLLEGFVSGSVKLDKCKILHYESEMISINSPPIEMASIYIEIPYIGDIYLINYRLPLIRFICLLLFPDFNWRLNRQDVWILTVDFDLEITLTWPSGSTPVLPGMHVETLPDPNMSTKVLYSATCT